MNRENQQLVLRNHELEERVANLTERLEVTKKSHENEVNMLVTKYTRENQLVEEVLQVGVCTLSSHTFVDNPN